MVFHMPEEECAKATKRSPDSEFDSLAKLHQRRM